jgi:hypothetical protein
MNHNSVTVKWVFIDLIFYYLRRFQKVSIEETTGIIAAKPLNEASSHYKNRLPVITDSKCMTRVAINPEIFTQPDKIDGHKDKGISGEMISRSVMRCWQNNTELHDRQ